MRLSCKQAEQWISLRIDGELKPLEANVALDSHVVACERCRELLAAERARAGHLRKALCSSLPETAELASAILERAADLPPASPGEILAMTRGPWMGTWRKAACVAALFLGSVWAGWTMFPGPASTPVSPPVASGPVPELRVVWEETMEQSRILPDKEGQPVRRDVELRRRLVLPPSGPAAGAGGRNGGGMGVEMYDARNVRLVTWPYR